MPPPDHAVRLRDGDREIEVSGNPAFVRQVLDDLPTLMARLRGEAHGRSNISMPGPPGQASATAAALADEPAVATEQIAPEPLQPSHPAGGNGSRNRVHRKHSTTADGSADLEDRVFHVLRGSTRPLAVAAIRQRLDGPEVSGQQVRRLLERAGSRVTVSADHPATYSLR